MKANQSVSKTNIDGYDRFAYADGWSDGLVGVVPATLKGFYPTTRDSYMAGYRDGKTKQPNRNILK